MNTDKKTLSRRELNAMEMKNKIFNTAIMLFTKHGYEKVKVDDIIKYAGVSKGSFYSYFPSKDSVLVDLFHKIDDHYEQTFKSVPPGESAGNRLLIFAKALGEYCGYVCGINVMKVVYMNQIGLHKRPPIINNKERTFYRVITDIVRLGRSTGEFINDMSEEEMVEFITRSVRSLVYDWCLYDGAFDLGEEGQRHFGILVDLLTAKSRDVVSTADRQGNTLAEVQRQ